MGTVQRPEITIKVYPENLVSDNKLQILKKLKTTNALILNLTEQLPKNKPFPFITIKRISSSEQLPKNLKLDGDPWSDYFITLKSFRNNGASTTSSSSSGKFLIFLALLALISVTGDFEYDRHIISSIKLGPNYDDYLIIDFCVSCKIST